MTTNTSESLSKINFILNKPSNWLPWFFVIQDTTKTNKVWQYIDLLKKKDELLKLEPPKQPIPADVLPAATLIAKLDPNQLIAYN